MSDPTEESINGAIAVKKLTKSTPKVPGRHGGRTQVGPILQPTPTFGISNFAGFV
jgi:hypothetical protein